MSKFICEIDTETKMATFTIDGKEVDVQEFTLSKYVCCGGYYKPEEYVSVCYSKVDSKTGDRNSNSVSFDSKSISESSSNYSIAKDVYKSIAKLQATDILNKALASYKIK